MACIFALDNNDPNEARDETLGWCGASIGFGLVSIPLERTARLRKHKVVSAYNSKY